MNYSVGFNKVVHGLASVLQPRESTGLVLVLERALALSLGCLSHEELSASLWEGGFLDKTDG